MSSRQQAALLHFGEEGITVCDTLSFNAVIEASRQLGTSLFSHKNVHEVYSRWHVI